MLDLFIIEGQRSLIKVALTILSYMYEQQWGEEEFVDKLKHFGEVVQLDNL